MEGEEQPKEESNIIDDSKLINIGLLQRQMEVSKKICEEYEKGGLTIDSCCEAQGIAYRTFNDWLNKNAEVATMYKTAIAKAEQTYKRELKRKCATALEKLVEGFSVEEIHQTATPIFDDNGNQIAIKQGVVKRIKKHYAPNVTAVIFALKALDPDTYKDNVPPLQAEEQVFLIGGKEIKF